MASRKPETLSNGGWNFKRGEVESKYCAVTHENRKNAIKYGRILYVIEGLRYGGYFTVNPYFTKGMYRYPHMPWEVRNGVTHWKVYYPEDGDYEYWKESFRTLIDKFINEKTLYINPSDPLVTYFKDK